MKKFTFLDLFSGCGGFSNGLEQAGFECLAGIDFNEHAISTFKKNHSAKTVALVKDMTDFSPEELSLLIHRENVDLIVGGPPCQGFSIARQSAGSNSGHRLVSDSRRELYKDFFRFIEFFKPKIFVMENVLGVKKSQNGIYYTAIQNEARSIGYRVSAVEINAWEFGVPQKRIRQLFIGTLIDLPIFVPSFNIEKTHSLLIDDQLLLPIVTLGEAIEDLPVLKAGDERVEQEYDMDLRAKYLNKYSGKYLTDVINIENSKKLLWHCSRPHNDRDLRDFARLLEGETCSKAISRGVEMEFPYNRNSFKDRYTKQSRSGLCSTIVAHLKADGLMFIHPTQNRSLTPREAARVQTFPDTFEFSGSRSHIFTQIGNAVPPLVGKAIGSSILKYFKIDNNKSSKVINKVEKFNSIKILEAFINKVLIENISNVSDHELLKLWKIIHNLMPYLHPEAATDNGQQISHTPSKEVSFCIEPYYLRSGWPVELVPIALEIRKRYVDGRLAFSDYYHSH
jgi:DNA (cytosine-5)-methyltransferase 1